jgi:hypothetical protein
VSAAPESAPPIATGDSTKLMEEVKLWWQIQIAMIAVLGFLGSHLSIHPATAAEAATNAILCLVALFLFTIGSIYNLVGSYYIRLEGVILGRDNMQDDFTTSYLSCFYLLVSGLIAVLGFYRWVQGAPTSIDFVFEWKPFLECFFSAFAVEWLVGLLTYRRLTKLDHFDVHYFRQLRVLVWPFIFHPG